MLACNHQGHSNEVISGHRYDDVTNTVARMEDQSILAASGVGSVAAVAAMAATLFWTPPIAAER